MLRWRCWISLTLLLVPATGAAQSPRLPAVGQRVRAAHHCKVEHGRLVDCRPNRSPRVVEGRLRALDADTVRLRPDWGGPDVAIPADLTPRVWVVDGTRTNFWAGAGIGMFVGALLGAGFGSMTEYCIMSDCGPATLPGVAVGAPIGLLVGGIIGAAVRTERWREVPRSSWPGAVDRP